LNNQLIMDFFAQGGELRLPCATPLRAE